jgi:hypothetical protein
MAAGYAENDPLAVELRHARPARSPAHATGARAPHAAQPVRIQIIAAF